MTEFHWRGAVRSHLMVRPIRHSLMAAIAVAPLGIAGGVAGDIARLLTVFFACHSLLLLVVSLFTNVRWRLAPPPPWRLAGAAGKGPVAW